MGQRGPPFDFDLNEPPPPEKDEPVAPVMAPEPTPQHDPVPSPVPEPSPEHDPLQEPEPASHEQMLAPSLAPVPEASPQDPLPAPLPAPVLPPSPYDSRHPPSPVVDLEGPLSSLDDEDEYEDEANLPLPPPPPLPSFRMVSPRAAPQVPHGDSARHSSPENSAPRGPSRSASDTKSSHSHRSRRGPYDYDPRDDAISKQRRLDSYDYERSGLASPRPYGQDGGRHAPPAHAHGQPAGAPPRNRRGRWRPQRPQRDSQYQGPVQRHHQGRDQEEQQRFRGQQRPDVHRGPHGPELPKVGYSSHSPFSGPPARSDGHGGRQSSKQEAINGNGGYPQYHHQRREAPPFRQSSRPHSGWEDPYAGRQSQPQEPPKTGGGYQHRDAPSFRPPPSGAHGRDGYGSSGERQRPAQQRINGGAYQQRKAPRGREDFPDRLYHPYARDGGDQARREREPRPDYERGRQYYGDVQK